MTLRDHRLSITSSPEELDDMLKRDLAVTARIIKAAGIQPE